MRKINVNIDRKNNIRVLETAHTEIVKTVSYPAYWKFKINSKLGGSQWTLPNLWMEEMQTSIYGTMKTMLKHWIAGYLGR